MPKAKRCLGTGAYGHRLPWGLVRRFRSSPISRLSILYEQLDWHPRTARTVMFLAGMEGGGSWIRLASRPQAAERGDVEALDSRGSQQAWSWAPDYGRSTPALTSIGGIGSRLLHDR